jgi:hypothetical protein
MAENNKTVKHVSSGNLIVEGLIICFILFLVLVAIDPQLDGLLSFTLPGFLALEVQLQR